LGKQLVEQARTASYVGAQASLLADIPRALAASAKPRKKRPA